MSSPHNIEVLFDGPGERVGIGTSEIDLRFFDPYSRLGTMKLCNSTMGLRQ